MINTIDIKLAQLTTGTYQAGSGEEVILIVGSCRSVPYLTYLRDWNAVNGNRFSIHILDPFSWNWDLNDDRTDYEAELFKQESNTHLLEVLSKTSIFIHEYYANAGMFNCDKKAEKNIYQFGLNPKIDITIPNYNDVFVLTREIVSFDTPIRKMAVSDYSVMGKLSNKTIELIEQTREKNLARFYKICTKTDFPEFAEIFKNDYKNKRYFWTFNHISKHFCHAIFNLMNDKFLKLDMSNSPLSEIDLYANNYTYLSEYDLGYNWDEEIKHLRDIV